jgi:hypothetical protein
MPSLRVSSIKSVESPPNSRTFSIFQVDNPPYIVYLNRQPVLLSNAAQFRVASLEVREALKKSSSQRDSNV